jgi:hypothetical protein
VGQIEFFLNERSVLQNGIDWFSSVYEPSAWPSPWTGHGRRGPSPRFSLTSLLRDVLSAEGNGEGAKGFEELTGTGLIAAIAVHVEAYAASIGGGSSDVDVVPVGEVR